MSSLANTHCTDKCTRCGEADHAAAACKKPFMRPQCSLCEHLGHTAVNCPKDSSARKAEKELRREAKREEYQARMDEMVCFRCGFQGHAVAECPVSVEEVKERKRMEQQARLDAMVCFRCGLQGHGRAKCPFSDEEMKERKRQERLSSTVCFKCGKKGHVKADCVDLESDAKSNASDSHQSVSTAATATEAVPKVRAPQKCTFCGSLPRTTAAKGGVKARTDRCQTCWRLPEHNASQ